MVLGCLIFFVDDSMVFCKADKEECQELLRVLKLYEQASGQKVNMDKSSVLFSSNTKAEDRSMVMHLFSIN